MYRKIFVIDPDSKRRAGICYALQNGGLHAEPFESFAEFFIGWPKHGVIATLDEGNMIASLMKKLGSHHSWLPVMGYSHDPQPSVIVNAALNGAVGYVAWPSHQDTFLKAVRECQERSTLASTYGPKQRAALAKVAALSSREKEILAGISEGFSNREIGRHLHISPRTVELHRSNLLQKLGARSSSEAIRIGVEAALSPFGKSSDAAEA